MVKGVGSKIKWKRKKWYNVYAPAFLGNALIGQTPGIEASQIKGRNLLVSVSEVTGDPRKQDYTMTFKITAVTGSNANAIITSFSASSSPARRMVRKGASRVDVNHTYETKDEKKIYIKTMLSTASKIEAAKKKDINVKALDCIKKIVSKHTYDEFVLEVAKSRIQDDIRKMISKIHPLRHVEILGFTNLSE